MTGIDELERTIARFEQARDELDAKIREAHAATKDARTAQRELTDLVRNALPAEARAALDQVVAPELAKLLDQIVAGMHDTETRITARFDTIANILMGEDPSQRRAGKPTLEEMVLKVAEG